MAPQQNEASERLVQDAAEWSTLMARAQDGDAASYRRLLRGITPYLRAVAARAFRDRADREDVVQDILLTLHSIRYAYDRTRPFKPWLAGIAQHRVADRLRAGARSAARQVPLGPEHETFAAQDANTGQAALDGRALREALDKIPEGQRRAVTMLKLEEMTLQQAASASGVSVASLKVATHRGINALRRLLVPGGGHQ